MRCSVGVGGVGEPDEWDGQVVLEGVGLEEPREGLRLAEVCGVVVGVVLAGAPVDAPGCPW